MRKLFIGMSLLLLAAGVISAAPVQRSSADEPEVVRLGIRPLDYGGQYFDLTMAPGESRILKVELANHAKEEISARTYASDVYSIINGGFGAQLDGAETTGETEWLTYEAATLEIPGGQAIIRSFSVAVPPETGPGEYITSLVIQNAEATAAGTANVAVKHIQRTVIAFVVTVPGERKPSLVIGEVRHEYAAKTSVVSAVVTNSGNVRLKPAGEIVIHDDRGSEVSRFAVAMDSVYSGDTTSIEVPLERALLPGDYRLSLTLSHEGGSSIAEDVPFNVPVATEAEAAGAPTGAQTNSVNQGQPDSPAHYVSWPRGIAGGTALLFIIAAAWLLLRRRGRRPTHDWREQRDVPNPYSEFRVSPEGQTAASIRPRPSFTPSTPPRERRVLGPAPAPSGALPAKAGDSTASAATARPETFRLGRLAGQRLATSLPGQRADRPHESAPDSRRRW